MAFEKYANARVRKENVDPDDWFDVRKASVDSGGGRDKTASVDIGKFNPNDYLLTHATIIASVDVDEVEGVKTGEIKTSSGDQIYRPHQDYYITPDTSQYVNHNGDSWERDLLLSTYRTFVGSENYVEHVQVPELSKGKVVDAVARDLGDTVYVDILVATDRKHESLVNDIVSGRINTLSMGCTIQYSLCTRCGNVARDEKDLCDHVLRQKGSTFVDDEGNERVVAELCGHKSDPSSVEFIEASWVANPAFEGAVMRNVLNPDVAESKDTIQSMGMSGLIDRAFTSSSVSDPSGYNVDDFFKTASANTSHTFGPEPSTRNASSGELDVLAQFGRDDEEEEDSGGEQGFVDEVAEDVKDEIKKRIFNELKDEIEGEDDEPIVQERSEEMPEAERTPNDSVIEGQIELEHAVRSATPDTYTKAVVMDHLKKNLGSEDPDLSGDFRVTAMYLDDSMKKGGAFAEVVNKCLTRLGAFKSDEDPMEYLANCAILLDRIPTASECFAVLERADSLQD